jgi:hypothetical protein
MRTSDCGITKDSIVMKTNVSENLPSPLFAKEGRRIRKGLECLVIV